MYLEESDMRALMRSTVLVSLPLFALAAPGTALGQSLKEQIVGAWRLASIYNEDNGVKMHLYGEKPVGIFIFDRSGNFSQFLSKPELPKFAQPNRLKGTDKEYRDVMQGMIAGFGTYSVEGDTVTLRWVASSYPNRAGTTEKRTYKVTGEELSSVNLTAASGGTSYTKFVRAK
jgi:Lipocalin-like domain